MTERTATRFPSPETMTSSIVTFRSLNTLRRWPMLAFQPSGPGVRMAGMASHSGASASSSTLVSPVVSPS